MNTVFWVWQSHYNHDLIGNMAATLGLHKTVNSNPGLWKELAGSNSSLLNYLVMMDSGEGKLLSSVVYTSMGKIRFKAVVTRTPFKHSGSQTKQNKVMNVTRDLQGTWRIARVGGR